MKTEVSSQKSEKPILFTDDMVRAILADLKTQTRRVIKPQPGLGSHAGIGDMDLWFYKSYMASPLENEPFKDWYQFAPYKVGDLLWVRETFRPYTCSYNSSSKVPVEYKADKLCSKSDIRWKPSIYMPKWAVRIWLEVTAVRLERVRDISINDIKAEGVDNGKSNPAMGIRYDNMQRIAFEELWDSINEKRGFSWDSNPWVWVYEFVRREA